MANRAKLEKEIKEYCSLNNITDVAGFITQCMLRGFNIFKYGFSPADNIKRQNGEIVDNGKNKPVKTLRKTTIQTPDTTQIIKKVSPTITDTTFKQVKTETPEKKEEIIKEKDIQPSTEITIKRRKIKITNIDTNNDSDKQ